MGGNGERVEVEGEGEERMGRGEVGWSVFEIEWAREGGFDGLGLDPLLGCLQDGKSISDTLSKINTFECHEKFRSFLLLRCCSILDISH